MGVRSVQSGAHSFVLWTSTGGGTSSDPGITFTSLLPTSDATGGGSVATLTGSGFVGPVSVTFGAASSQTKTVVTNSSITCTVPSSSASGGVTVTVTQGGRSAALSGFTYLGVPTLTAVAPTSIVTDGGTTLTLTGTQFSPSNTTVGIVSVGTVVKANTHVSATCSSLTLSAPSSNTTGTFDIRLQTPSGLVTLSSALSYVATSGCVSTNTYFNTSETTTASTILADSFCRGWWYNTDGTPTLANAGWCGVSRGGAPNPAGAIIAVSSPPSWMHSNYAAHSGTHDGDIGGRNMAQHFFPTPVDEAWVRYYIQPQSDYVGGHEKMLDFIYATSVPVGGGEILELIYNRGGGGQIQGIPYLHQDNGLPGPPPDAAWLHQNVTTPCILANGHWFFVEKHVKLNTAGSYDGVWELWMDDLGTSGTSIPASPTLRGQYTNVLYRSTGAEASLQLSGIWIENWANPGTVGTMYYATLKAATAGPIGFASS